jgi:hypothetical protein
MVKLFQIIFKLILPRFFLLTLRFFLIGGLLSGYSGFLLAAADLLLRLTVVAVRHSPIAELPSSGPPDFVPAALRLLKRRIEVEGLPLVQLGWSCCEVVGQRELGYKSLAGVDSD